MSAEQTLIVVKPDGLAKGLVGQILRAIESHGLTVVDSARLHLSRNWVESLYESERNEVYFTEVVDWVSSAPVLLLKVQGEQAIEKVKWQIIGRYPNGIRGQYSENWIRNVAHAPDSVQSTARELGLVSSLFEERREADKIRLQGKIVFALTGMSECGKSTVGQYLDSRGFRRLKIVRIFEKVRDKWSPTEELQEFLKLQEFRDPYALWDLFTEELLLTMEKSNVNSVSIESLYGGGLGPYLAQRLKESLCLIFIDIPTEIRLQRQMQRENLTTIEEAKRYLLPRDEIKEKSGIPYLREIADEVVDNSGTLGQLYQAIDTIIKKHRK